MFISAIDIGTNSFHMIVAEEKNNSFRIVDREREVIRLGSVKEGHITEDEMSYSVVILNSFRRICNFYGASIKAVGTSAIRDADNSEDFINRIFTETGICIEVVEGKREAELIYKGVQYGMNTAGKKVLCIDIGGGSTEIIYDNERDIVTESFPLGAVRLTTMFFPDYILTEKSIARCSSHINKIFRSSNIIKSAPQFSIAIGTSGTIQAAASVINYFRNGYPLKIFTGYKFSIEELENAANLVIKASDPRSRAKIGGMEEKRADIIQSGIMILLHAAHALNIKEMNISSFALREGILSEQLSLTK
jgi:exopolyphosphatase/guanosine-5'-triphosphate,3'-diphosphate pyrophosphatase